MPPTTDEEEERKRITSTIMSGDGMVLIDNIDKGLGSAALDALITGTVWKDRLLGLNRIVELAITTIFCGSGINLFLKGDMIRRVLQIRLRCDEEGRDEKRNFKYAHLLNHVRQVRGSLIHAALTI